jgi:hypothetical protein
VDGDVNFGRADIILCPAMTTPKKFTLPDIAREELAPHELELLAFVEKLADLANGLQEHVEQLEEEVARLKKAKERA